MYSSLVKITVFLSLIFLAGCASGPAAPPASGAPGSAEWFGSASQSTINDYYRQTCKSYNFPSQALVNNCIQDEIATAKKSAGVKD